MLSMRDYLSGICWIVLLALPTMGKAQAQDSCHLSLSGRVLDDHDRTPLSFATIFIEGLQKGAISDSLGYYRIDGLCAGEYIVQCEHIGCEPVQAVVNIQGNANQDFFPDHHAEELKAVTIAALKRSTAIGHAEESISGAELDKAKGKSLGESLKEIPGVNTLQTGPTISKPVIHGLHSNRVLVLNNEVRQEDQQWGSEHAPEIDPFIASKISVIKGAGVVRYGSDAIGGVILVEPAALPHDAGMNGEVNLVGMSNGRQGYLSARFDGGFKKWQGFGWRIQGTLKKAGDMHAPEYNLSNTGATEKNSSAELGLQRKAYTLTAFYSYVHKQLGVLKASHIGNLTDLENALDSEKPWYIDDFTYHINSPRQKMEHHLVKTKGRFIISKNWRLETQYSFQLNRRQEFDIRRGGKGDAPSIDLNLQTHAVDITVDNQKGNLHSQLGIAGFYQRNFNEPGTGTRPLIPNYKNYAHGIYVIERYTKDLWEAELGLRYDYKLLNAVKFDIQNELVKPELGFHNFSGTLGYKIRILEGISFSTNIGFSFRPPNVSELFSEGLHHGAAAIEEGDIELETEKGVKWTGTLAYRFQNRVDLQVTGYYNHIADYIYLQPQPELRLTIRGAFPVFDYVQTDAGIGGMDFSIKFLLFKNLYFHSKGSYIQARDISNDEGLVFIPAHRFENELSYQVATWKKVADFNIGFGCQNVLEQKRAPEDMDFTDPPPGYMLFHVDAGLSFPVKKGKISFHFSIENLFNKSYRDYLNRFRYYAEDTGRNFVLRMKYVFKRN